MSAPEITLIPAKMICGLHDVDFVVSDGISFCPVCARAGTLLPYVTPAGTVVAR